MTQIKLTSDGHHFGTEVIVNGVKIKGVKEVHFVAAVGQRRRRCELWMKVEGPFDVEVEGALDALRGLPVEPERESDLEVIARHLGLGVEDYQRVAQEIRDSGETKVVAVEEFRMRFLGEVKGP